MSAEGIKEKYIAAKTKGKVCSKSTVRRKSKFRNTKKWCRGKVDIEHKLAWVENNSSRLYIGWFDYVCTECGKRFDYCSKFAAEHRGRCKCGHHQKGS